jgi:hypothetical protein
VSKADGWSCLCMNRYKPQARQGTSVLTMQCEGAYPMRDQ